MSRTSRKKRNLFCSQSCTSKGSKNSQKVQGGVIFQILTVTYLLNLRRTLRHLTFPRKYTSLGGLLLSSSLVSDKYGKLLLTPDISSIMSGEPRRKSCQEDYALFPVSREWPALSERVPNGLSRCHTKKKYGRTWPRQSLFWYDTYFYKKKKKKKKKKKIPPPRKKSKKSVSYQKKILLLVYDPSFGMTPTQAMRDLYA